MRLRLTAAAAALVAAAASPSVLSAQWTPIPLNTTTTFTVTEGRVLADRSAWNEGYSYDGRVKPGTTLTVRMVWLTRPANPNIAVTISDPGRFSASTRTLNTTMNDGSVVATKTFSDSGGIVLIVSGNGAPVGHRYAITITEGSAAGSASTTVSSIGGTASPYKTTGFELSVGYGPVTFASDIATEKGAGGAGRIGYSFGYVSLFGEGQMSEMSMDEDATDDDYRLVHAEAGGRVYLTPPSMRFRPYGQAAYGIRRLTTNADAEAQGMGPTYGAGAQFFLGETLSLEGAWRQSTGDIDRIRASSSDEWQDIDPAFVITGKSTRLVGMLSVHF